MSGLGPGSGQGLALALAHGPWVGQFLVFGQDVGQRLGLA